MGERLRWSFREKLLDIYDWLEYCQIPLLPIMALLMFGCIGFYIALPTDMIVLALAMAVIFTVGLLGLIALYFVGLAIVNGLEDFLAERIPEWRGRLGIGSKQHVTGAMRHTPIH